MNLTALPVRVRVSDIGGASLPDSSPDSTRMSSASLSQQSSGSVVVGSMLIIIPFVGFCNCSMFCCALLFVYSSFAIILAGCFTLFVSLMSRDCCLTLPHDATGLFAVFDCGFS